MASHDLLHCVRHLRVSDADVEGCTAAYVAGFCDLVVGYRCDCAVGHDELVGHDGVSFLFGLGLVLLLLNDYDIPKRSGTMRDPDAVLVVFFSIVLLQH